MDTFICGSCQESFHDITLFVSHKNSQCAATPEAAVGQTTQVFSEIHIEPQQNQQETIAVIQSAVDGSEINENGEAQRQMCLVQINGSEPHSGVTPELHLVQHLAPSGSANFTTEVGDISLILQENPQPPPKPTGRRPGRPRKGEEKTPKPVVSKPPERLQLPERADDGKFHCPRCKKCFGKERHFITHKCLAVSDFVNILEREVMSDEESGEDENEDKSLDFRLAPRRGRPPRARSVAHIELPTGEALIRVKTEGHQAVLQDGETTLNQPVAQESEKLDVILPVTNDQITSIPVFADEEEKLAFEETLNVDLSEVDSMYKTHIIDQNVNEHAPTPACRTASELSVFSCTVCDKVFKTVSHMRLHCLTHTDLKPFKCTRCSYASNSKGNLYTHMRIHTGQFYTCPACEFKSPNKTHLVEHISTHSKERHKCGLCKKDYNTQKSLVNHVRKYHTSKAGREYLERFQGKQNQGSAVLHQCHICLRKFKKKIDRDRHLFVHNIRGLPNVHECDLCDHTATQRRYLEQHYLRHRVIYTCAECSAKFPSSARLIQHLEQTHSITDAAENWVEIFQQCMNASLYLPEPDGSTDNLFSVPGEADLADVSAVPGGEQVVNGKEASQGQAVVIEPVQPLENELPPAQGMLIDQGVLSSADTNVSKALLTDTQPRLEENQSEESQVVMITSVHKGDSPIDSDIPQSSTSNPVVQDLPDGSAKDGEKQGAGSIKGGAELQELEEPDQDMSEEALALEAAEDYDIYKRLGYSPMSIDIFHKLRATFGSEECEFCGRLFYSKSDYITHFRSHTGERPFSCTQCTYRASTKDALKRHIEKEHDKVTYVCQECDHIATSRTQLWHHQQKHKEPHELKCTVCDISFPSTKRLRTHISVKHPSLDKALVKKMLSVCQKPQGKLGRRSHKCPYCSKTFMRGSADLQKHIWIHQGIKPFKCSLCPHACRSKNNLMSHMLRHSAAKPFLCNECGKAYKSRTALRWHIRTHKDGKIFRCNKCSYQAVQYSHLKRHMQTHDVVKRFVCQYCSYSSNTIGYMKIHHTRYHKGKVYRQNPNPAPQMAPDTKVYRCLSCDYLFGNLSDIKRHLKVRHHVSVEDIHALDNFDSSQQRNTEVAQPQQVIQTGEMIQDPEPIQATESMRAEGSLQQTEVIQTSDIDQNIEVVAGENAEQHVPQSEVQVVEMMETEPAATMEEEDAGRTLQSLQYAGSNMDPQTASAVNILQQIIGMSKQGAFAGQHQITVQSEDGQSYVAVNPDTIIVQDTDELVITDDGQEGAQQYVIQYVTQTPSHEEGEVIAGGSGRASAEETEVAVLNNTEIISDVAEHQLPVDQEAIQLQTPEIAAQYEDNTEQNIHIIMQEGDVSMAMTSEDVEVPVQVYTDVQDTTISEQTIATEVVVSKTESNG